MSNVWYRDSDTGEIYQDRKDSTGRTVRVYGEASEEPSRPSISSSRTHDSRPPRARRESIYSHASAEISSGRHHRARSSARDIAHENDRAEGQGLYRESSRQTARQSDDSAQTYLEPADSRRQESRSYYPSAGFNRRHNPSSTYEDAPLNDNTERLSQTGIDSLSTRFGDIDISGGDHYTLSSSLPVPSTVYPDARTTEEYIQDPIPVASAVAGPDQQNTGSNVQQRNPRHIAGTRGKSEKIDKSYTVRTHDYREFFKVGRVFSTLWTDALGSNAHKIDPTFVSQVIYDERVYSKVRRFVIVREGDRSVTCLPVTSYDGAGHRKPGIILGDHGFIYSQRKPRTVAGMRPSPLKLTLARGAAHLQDPSLVNYAKVYTVETNVKVKNIGHLDNESKEILEHYFWKVFAGNKTVPGDTTPRASSSLLAGVGSGLNPFAPAYADALPSSSNASYSHQGAGMATRPLAPNDQTSEYGYGTSMQSATTFVPVTPQESAPRYTGSSIPAGSGYPPPASGYAVPSSHYSTTPIATGASIAESPYQVSYAPGRVAMSSQQPQGGYPQSYYPQATSNDPYQGGGTSYSRPPDYYGSSQNANFTSGSPYYPASTSFTETPAWPQGQIPQYQTVQPESYQTQAYSQGVQEEDIDLGTLESARLQFAGRKRHDSNYRRR